MKILQPIKTVIYKPRCFTTICNSTCCQNVPMPFQLLSTQINKGNGVRQVFMFSPSKNTPEIMKRHGINICLPLTVKPLIVDGKPVIDVSKNWCPFLKVNKRCNIYKKRAVICEEFGTKVPCPEQLNVMQFCRELFKKLIKFDFKKSQ